MIKSMTGHGRVSMQVGTKTVVAEVRSVNSRYMDVSCKLPRLYSRFEEKIKQLLSEYAVRGKVDIYVGFENYNENDEQTVTLNRAYLESYLAALDVLCSEYGLRDDRALSTLALNPDVFTVTKKTEDDDEKLWAELEPVLRAAFEEFANMRATEGEKLKDDVLSKLCELCDIVEKIKVEMPDVVAAYKERLTSKIKEVLGDREIDEARVITEVAIFADKVAVDEETVRLDSHISQFRTLLSESTDGTGIGRKLDFLLQEINREINTTGSKATSAKVAMLVVDAKSTAEKIREQIQNIE